MSTEPVSQDRTEPPPGPVRRRRSRARHDARFSEIVDVAASLFAERGYHATSIQDLSDATGLQRGALYHYIGGKKDLLFAIHERFIEPLLSEARGIQAGNLPPEEAIRALARALMGAIDEFGDQVTVFLHEWKTIRNDPEAAGVRDARREFEEIVEEALARGVRDGQFAVRDLRLTTLAFLGMINYSYQWYVPGGRFTAGQVTEDFSEIFLKGILKRG
jgi:AcrR family transcriptional regulator